MKSSTSKRVSLKKKINSIVDGWTRLAKQKPIGKLNEQEKTQFDKARFAEEQVKSSTFVLGGQINRNSRII